MLHTDIHPHNAPTDDGPCGVRARSFKPAVCRHTERHKKCAKCNLQKVDASFSLPRAANTPGVGAVASAAFLFVLFFFCPIANAALFGLHTGLLAVLVHKHADGCGW